MTDPLKPQRPIIPDPDAIIGKGIDALVAERPRALSYINNSAPGAYGNIFNGFRAQLALMLKRLTSGVVANRVPTATGADLIRWATSEIGPVPDLGPKKAIGSLELYRPGVGDPGNTPGLIPAGTVITRLANSTSALQLVASSYVTTTDSVCGPHDTDFTVAVEAVTAGAAGNCPLIAYVPLGGSDSNQSTFHGSFFDPTFTIIGGSVAGGSDGATNDDLRNWIYQSGHGQYGPTLGNLSSQVLIENGVANFAILDDPYAAQVVIYVADKSWASSTVLCSTVQASLTTGANSVVKVCPIDNVLVQLQAHLSLKDPNYVSSQTEIASAVQAGAKAYLDNRPDWYVWDINGLNAAIIEADARIQSVISSSLVYAMAVEADKTKIGTVVPEVTSDPRYDLFGTPYVEATNILHHYYLTGAQVTVSFLNE